MNPSSALVPTISPGLFLLFSFYPIFPLSCFAFIQSPSHPRVSNSTHNLPEAGVVLVGLLVEALLLRDAVLGVDEAAAFGGRKESC